MKDFFKMLGASTLGFVIGSILLTLFSFMIFMGIVASMSGTPAYELKDKSVLEISLEGVISDRVTDSPFDALLTGSNSGSQKLDDMLSAIEKAKDNDKIRGIYIKAGFLSTGFASLEPLRKAIVDFKESGKFVIAYGETIPQNTYYIASAADKVYMNPQGTFALSGLGWSTQFNKEVFKKWGIDIQVFKVGTYKSAVEPYIETKMSDANREQVTSYLNDIWMHMLGGISESRGVSVDDLNRYADEFLMFSEPNTVVSYGLVDGLRYGNEVEEEIKSLLEIEEKDKINRASVSNMMSMPEIGSKNKKTKDTIAVLYAEGTIDSDAGSSVFSGTNITAEEYVKELNKLKDDENVKAVVFRVNSGGGSAYASEQIWFAVKELRAVKPVIVSMGDYAASGGYYISCGANKIVAEHNTITGSIGIFGMFPSGEQLAERMGAHFDGVGTNKHSLFGGNTLSIPFIGLGLLPARALDKDEQLMLQTYVERGYDLFLTRCAEGRGMSKEQIDAIGQGRVWTGNQARELGLVDEIGGLDRAIALAAEAAGIEDFKKSAYPIEKDFFTKLLEETSSGVSARLTKVFVGEEAYKQKQMLKSWQNFDYRQAILID